MNASDDTVLIPWSAPASRISCRTPYSPKWKSREHLEECSSMIQQELICFDLVPSSAETSKPVFPILFTQTCDRPFFFCCSKERFVTGDSISAQSISPVGTLQQRIATLPINFWVGIYSITIKDVSTWCFLLKLGYLINLAIKGGSLTCRKEASVVWEFVGNDIHYLVRQHQSSVKRNIFPSVWNVWWINAVR